MVDEKTEEMKKKKRKKIMIMVLVGVIVITVGTIICFCTLIYKHSKLTKNAR